MRIHRIPSLTLTIATVLVGASALNAAEWTVPGDFATIQNANDSSSVVNSDILKLAPGAHAGALLTKQLEIRGEGGATISTGPAHSSGLLQGFRLLTGSTGTTLSNLRFEGVDLAIMNGAAVNDVTVDHCTFVSTIQAISNWGGSGWQISHNVITDLRTRNGGGIGIFIGDFAGGTVMDNVVSHNKINGTLNVSAGDLGGYAGTGIVLYADFRWRRAGTANLAFNRVVKNKIALVSDNPSVVDVVAVELTDSRDDGGLTPVITDNAIGFNDLRGTAIQISLTPDNLDTVNSISRNLGENRGHGLHPSVFFPHE